MDQFVRRENVERFRLMVEEIIADKTERERTLKLLAEKWHKQKNAERQWTEGLSQVAASAIMRGREP